MGSEGPSAVTVHVTGFKKFHGVAENPTEMIVSNLKSFMEKRGLPKGLVLGRCTVLEAAGQGALATLYEMLESAMPDKVHGSSNQGQIIWLHLGAIGGATRFAIENQAVNEATFCCPDELGWKPQMVCIVPSDGSISRTRQFKRFLHEEGGILKLVINIVCIYLQINHPYMSISSSRGLQFFFFIGHAFFRSSVSCHYLPFLLCASAEPHSVLIFIINQTTLPVNEITKSLRKIGYDVMPSNDAGRFVCNYVYYHSLRFAEQHGMKSLFVHVPLISTIDEEVQMHFAGSLLEALACFN